MDRIIKKKRWTFRKALLVGSGTLLAFFLLYVFAFADTSSKLHVDAARTRIATVREASFQESIPVTGVVRPSETVLVPAVEGGTVTRKYLEGGSLVRQGDTLLKLDNNRLVLDVLQQETHVYDLVNQLQDTKLSLEQNKLNLRRTLATLDYELATAQKAYDRHRLLFAAEAVSEHEYLAAQRDYERLKQQRASEMEAQQFEHQNAMAQIKQLESTIARTTRHLKTLERNLHNRYITAPVTGQWSVVQAELGAPISQGQIVGRIDELDTFKVRAAIDERYISRIFAGLRGEFALAGHRYPLEVTLVCPEVQQGAFWVDMDFVGRAPASLRRGQTLQIRLQLGDPAPAVLLPRGGFYQTTGGHWIFVVEPAGQVASKRKIRLGRQNPEYHEVLEGLQPGESVLVSSYETYGDVEKLVME